MSSIISKDFGNNAVLEFKTDLTKVGNITLTEEGFVVDSNTEFLGEVHFADTHLTGNVEIASLEVTGTSSINDLFVNGNISLTNTSWDDLRTPATGINPSGSPSPATPNTTDGSLTFSKGNVAIAWFQMPHAWKQGSDISIHMHWSKDTTNNGTVHWQMKYKWFNIGSNDPGFSALADGTEIVPNSNTIGKHALLEWPDASGVGKTLSSMICVFIQRTNDGGDTFTGTPNLYEIDIHYEIDSMGSNTEYTK